MNNESTLIGYRKRLSRVLLYIEQHLDEDVSLERLAAVAHFSPFHFHRVFSGMVGESVKSYVRRLRLDRAAFQLNHNKQSITTIALQAGYESSEAFARAFQSKFNSSPSQYRGSMQEEKKIAVEQFVAQLPRGESIMQVEVKHVNKMRAVCIRHVGPYQECAAVWEQLCSFKSIPMGAETKFIGVCHDDPEVTAPEKIRYDACITVPEDFKAPAELTVCEIGGGKYAVAEHVGPYENLHAFYNQLCGQWAPENGYELRAEPSFEIYLNDPTVTPPEQLRTEVYIPV